MFTYRIRLISFLSLFLLLAGVGAYSDAQDFDAVEIQTVKVTEGVYLLIGSGGNIGVSAGEDSVFMIDDQYAPLTDKIKDDQTKDDQTKDDQTKDDQIKEDNQDLFV